MEMLPRPQIGALRRLRKFSVFAAFRVHQRNVPLVFFGLFVHQRKHTGSARKPHGNHGYLLRHFVHCLRGTPRHAEEWNDKAERNRHKPRFKRRKADVFDSRSEEQTAADRQEHVGEVSDIPQNRAEHVAVDVRVFRVVEQFFVVFIEIGFGLLFVREHFHHFLPFHHLFHEAFFLAERLLLRHHVFRGSAAHFFHHHEH